MKIIKYVMLTFLALILIVFISGFVFFQTAPQIGANPEGERLERMKEAPNFKDGKFENTVETLMKMSFSSLRKVLKEQFFSSGKERQPQEQITTVPFSADAFSKTDSAVAITWFGHSTLLIQIDGVTILTDPVLVGKRASMFSFVGPERFNYDHHIELDELPPVDVVIISHDHYDHLDYPTIKKLAEKVDQFYMPLGVGAHFEHWGVKPENIVELKWWDEVEVGGIKLALTPTRHFSGRAIRDRFNTLWGSWVISGKSKNLYFSGDSGYFPGFKEIGEKYGPFDLTFMECGAYNEGWSEIHMFPEETAQAHLDVQGKFLMPIHWGKFDLSLHPWKESVERLTKKAAAENIELVTPEVGQIFLLPDSTKYQNWWEQYQ